MLESNYLSQHILKTQFRSVNKSNTKLTAANVSKLYSLHDYCKFDYKKRFCTIKLGIGWVS